MPNEAPQSYENHVRRLPRLYLAVGILLLANIVFTTVVWWKWTRTLTLVPIVVAIALFGIHWCSRTNALAVQDRLIRLEERLRLAALLPDDLRKRIAELSVDQLVALRFASDEELPELTRQVLDEGLKDRKLIKKRIRNWRADHQRV